MMMKISSQTKRSALLLTMSFIGALTILAGAVFVSLNRHELTDWYKLRHYTPNATIKQIALDTSMTEKGTKLFYVNNPQVLGGSAFDAKCNLWEEYSIVLGCYYGNDNGIFLYDVTDSRLKGVVETTAAHEMLHAAYERLTPIERIKINKLLTDFYANGLKDARVKETVGLYAATPEVLTNEMHSIFATEVKDLPPELNNYYKQYFSNRDTVVSMAQKYENEFTSRRDLAAKYDAQLVTLKNEIDTNQKTIAKQQAQLEKQYGYMQALERRGDASAYNQQVVSYNVSVDAYNELLAATRKKIDDYNDIVQLRNTAALEENELVNALSGGSD